MYLVIHKQRLLVTSEVGPSHVIYGRVGPYLHRYWLRCCAVVNEHLGYFGVDVISRVGTYGQVLWEQVLSNLEVSILIGKDVDCLQCLGPISGPVNVYLDR